MELNIIQTALNTLGLKEVGLTKENLRKTFFDLSKKHHPDKTGGSSDMQAKINSAYNVLSAYLLNKDDVNSMKNDNVKPKQGFSKVRPKKSTKGNNNAKKEFSLFDSFKNLASDIFGVNEESIKNAKILYSNELNEAGDTLKKTMGDLLKGLSKDIFNSEEDLNELFNKNVNNTLNNLNNKLKKKKNQEAILGILSTLFDREIKIDNKKNTEQELKKQKELIRIGKVSPEYFQKLINEKSCQIEVDILIDGNYYQKKLLKLTILHTYLENNDTILFCKDYNNNMYRIIKL